MDFPAPLIKGRLIQRYKRFLSDIELENGEIVTAHCANSGSMLGLKEPGSDVWISKADNPKRKLRYTWELVKVGASLVGINTALPNKIVEEAIKAGQIPTLAGYSVMRREVKYGEKSRIDIFLQEGERPDCYVEVKSVTLSRTPGIAQFPDAVTARGTKHLQELSSMVTQGYRAAMVYLVQRDDCTQFELAGDIDPAYADAYKTARKAGVEILCYSCKINPETIRVDSSIQLVE